MLGHLSQITKRWWPNKKKNKIQWKLLFTYIYPVRLFCHCCPGRCTSFLWLYHWILYYTILLDTKVGWSKLLSQPFAMLYKRTYNRDMCCWAIKRKSHKFIFYALLYPFVHSLIIVESSKVFCSFSSSMNLNSIIINLQRFGFSLQWVNNCINLIVSLLDLHYQ